jgi:hypothetical protein
VSLLVELGGVLAEVPDVAVCILGVVIERPLLEVTGQVEAVGDYDARCAGGRDRPPGDADDVARRLAVLQPTYV